MFKAKYGEILLSDALVTKLLHLTNPTTNLTPKPLKNCWHMFGTWPNSRALKTREFCIARLLWIKNLFEKQVYNFFGSQHCKKWKKRGLTGLKMFALTCIEGKRIWYQSRQSADLYIIDIYTISICNKPLHRGGDHSSCQVNGLKNWEKIGIFKKVLKKTWIK